VSGPLDRRSKRIILAWVISDIIWAVIFVRSLRRSQREEAE
jgi:hypothetical protein